MLVLGIETATPVTSVAVGSEGGTLAAASLHSDRGHARHLVPTIRWVLEQAGVAPPELAAIAVGTGPGLFTGLRVGISTAKALAQVWGLPIVPVSSLDVLAFGYRDAAGTLCAAIDARRGEVFAGVYQSGGDGVRRLHDAEVLDPEGLAKLIRACPQPLLLVGDGLTHAAELAGPAVRVAAPAAPSAAALVALAARRLLGGSVADAGVEPFAVTPVYLRRPDADPAWERRLAALRAAGA